MTTRRLGEKNTSTAAIWMPVGLAIGSGLGASLGDIMLGLSLGLMLGGTIASAIDHQRKGVSAVWPILGAVAFVWILALTAIERG